MQPDPLDTRDLLIITALVAVAILVFSTAVSAISEAKPKFLVPPVVARK